MKKLYSFAFFFLIFVVKGFSESLYIVGSDAAFGGWQSDGNGPSSYAEMTYTNNKYVWIGDVNADTEFKFLKTNTAWFPAYTAKEEDKDVGEGGPFDLQYCNNNDCDYKFKISASGKYKIEVELGNSPKMTVTRLGDYGSDLYMIGTAIPGRWELEKAIPMKYADGKYTWVGDLIYNEEESGNTEEPPGQLKFITSNRGYYPAFVAESDDLEVSTNGDSYSLSYCGSESCGNDNKFKFASGKYKIEIELGTSPKMTVTRLGVYGELYMVGDAVSGDWELGGAQKMTYADGKYTWVGDLNNNTNESTRRELKFITSNRGYYPAFVAESDDLEVSTNGDSYSLSYCGSESCGNDNKFKFSSGKYKIEVELGTSPTMTVTRLGDYGELYMVGDAVSGDWELGGAQKMTYADGKYTWVGDLNNNTNESTRRELKFITSNGGFYPAFVASEADKEVEPGGGSYKLLYCVDGSDGDNKFKFSSGKYKIEVELGTSPTMTVTRLGDYGELYMVGDAVSGDWELGGAQKMTYADGKYTWVGDLISGNGNDSGQLKFITSNGGFYPAFVAEINNKTVEPGGGSYKLLYCVNGRDGDNKFVFSESGKYKIEVVLGTSPTMTVTRVGDYGMLYMVGDAVSDGWEPVGAQAMTYADGKYTWSGQLIGGEFKFLTTNTGLLPSYVSADADPGQSSKSIQINSGSQEFNLKYRDDANAGSVNDYNFEIDGTVYSGEYEICVKVGTSPTVTITKKTKDGIPNELYINGDIVGWDATKSIEMTTDGNPAGVFTWTGSLPHGELKFLTVSPAPGEARSGTNPWFPCYVATNGLSVVRMADNSVFEMKYRTEGTQNDVTDYKFFFYKGEYTLTVNLNGETPKLTVNGTIDNLDINTNELSLIGNAVVGSRAKFTPVPCNGKRVFVYTGKMKCGQTNTFRFAWEPNEWPGMVAMGGHLTKCTFDVPMSMVYIPSDKWENAYDWRFYIDGAENEVRDVVIRINIMENVNDMTMTITGKAEDEVNYNFSAMYDNTSGKNIIIDGVEGDYSVTYMNGELISGTNDYTNDLNFTVPCNGIYVVKANCISKKVLIY